MTNNNILNNDLFAEKNFAKFTEVNAVSRLGRVVKGWFASKSNAFPITTPNPQEVHVMMQNGNWMLLNAVADEHKTRGW